MHFLSALLSFGAIVGIASAAAVPVAAADPEAKPDPFFHALSLGYTQIPYVDKRSETPSKVKREADADPYFLNKDMDYYGATPIPAPKSKRQLTNIRPLLSRSWEHMLLQRTWPSTPTSGPDARKCGAVAGYACTSGNGSCCGGPNSGQYTVNMCGDTQRHCAGACQREFGYCTDPMFQIAFDADGGDVLWDPVTDNVFDANLGDGMLYYGYPLLDPETDDPIPWPSTV